MKYMKPHTRVSQLNDFMDLHCWIEHNGEVIDYADKDLKKVSLFGTEKVVRKEFNMELQKWVLPVIWKRYKAKMKLLNREPPMVRDMWLSMYKKRPGHCTIKAFEYYKANKGAGAKIKIGSLGFEQHDGGIFWEYG